MLPQYTVPPGAEALALRLRSLLTADVPVACPVYAGLGAPGPGSARHAEVTFTVASRLAEGTEAELPVFNTNPPPILRVLTAASWGRADALSSDMAQFPADIASDLFRAVERITRQPAGMSTTTQLVAADLMLRLGYLGRAAQIVAPVDTGAATHRFHPGLALKQLAVLFRRPHDPAALESRVLAAAGDRTLPPRIRLGLAMFVVVRNGRRGTDTPAMHEAAAMGEAAMAELPDSGAANHLSRQTYHRGVAYLPFLRKDFPGALDVLARAEREQHAARPETELERLAWLDHAFPLYETIARTNLVGGDAAAAVAATDRLIVMSPNDHRGWTMRGRALLAAGRLDDAAAAYVRIVGLGGLPVASAAFHLGWIHEQLGQDDRAREMYDLSRRVDPTALPAREPIPHA